MADWDSLISLKTKENEVEKPEVKELETVKNKDFISLLQHQEIIIVAVNI